MKKIYWGSEVKFFNLLKIKIKYQELKIKLLFHYKFNIKKLLKKT